MAKKRKNDIPPESDDEIQILYERTEDMEIWYDTTKKRKVSHSKELSQNFCDSFLKSNLFGCSTCQAKKLLFNIESMKH